MKTYARLAVLTGVVLVAVAPAPARAQVAAPTIETHAAKSRGAAGSADANVKRDAAAPNAMGAKIAAPADKGGAKTRGATTTGQLHVDNRTDLIIKIYVDGDFVGTVSPWGDSYGYYGCNVSLYARADFTDGTSTSWGPIRANVCNGYTWRLWP